MPRLSKIGAAALAAFGWTSGTSAVTATYLVVAGGGGGGRGYNSGGGGGAGGYRTGTLSLSPSSSYTITVGAGGAGSSSLSVNGANGADSVFSTITSTGGGGGGSQALTGSSGGSGGGGGTSNNSTTYAGGSGNTPSTTPSQGNNGGSGLHVPGSYEGAGGGGGSGAVGGNSSTGTGGSGGAGTANSISGSSVTYAGGGGGAGNTPGSGGSGGGGAASNGSATGGTGTANLGGGGGGGYSATSGGNGGSGIVIISYTAPQKFSGGVVTLSGGNVIHTFTTSGTLGPITTLSASYLIVAGGASGGNGNANIRVYGGGGAGGMLTGSGLTIDPNSTYIVTVGAGGASQTVANTVGYNGSNSSFSAVATTAVGGGNAGSFQSGNGGSGGGGGYDGSLYSPGSGTAGQGNNGGTGTTTGGGGGGGAGAVGGNASGGTGGVGGAGAASSISGTSTYYAGGGGGGGASSNGAGGIGGGGSGSTAGTANTGGGGGGTATNITSGAGGSGIVIISYPGSTQQMAGGTVTIVGGNVIHTFTSTGYLAPLKYVGNSLRFRSSASAYLSRTFKTPTSGTTWTWSGWVKRGILTAGTGTAQQLFSAGSATAFFRFSTTDTLVSGWTGAANLETTAVYRDPAAWYHIMLVVDTTQATSSNRVKYFVNGVQVTAFSTTDYPTQNSTTTINSAVAHNIGAYQSASQFFDGYMTEINFVDGQALTPNSFGTFNSYGVWQPITYGGSYGTNGFYLPFKAQTSSYVGSFNGSNQYLATTNTQIIPATGDFTVEAMIYKTNTNATIYSQGTTGNAGRLEVTVVGTTLGVQIGASSFSSTVAINNNQWYYIALTRTGSTATFYVNGLAAGSGTLSAAVQTTPFWIGLDWTSTYFGGYISNLRVSNVVRTISPATAPTSSFSNDANTVFLTLQNSSIVDNSTNAYSITNNNGVSTGQTYPFAYGIFNDQGPAGNNWTPNNVSGAFGTTLDYMTDVPTLTSATAANYPVLNPLYRGYGGYTATPLTFSDANLSVTGNASANNTAATMALPSSGKFYWEYVWTATAGGEMDGGIIGVAGLPYFYRYDGTYYNGSTYVAYGASYTTNDVIGVAIDMDNLTFTFYKNGVSQGTKTSAFPSGGTYFPWVYCSNTVGASINFGQRPFTYTPPGGYVALNTYNM